MDYAITLKDVILFASLLANAALAFTIYCSQDQSRRNAIQADELAKRIDGTGNRRNPLGPLYTEHYAGKGDR